MKKYFVEVTKENGAIADAQIVEASTPRNALIKYLNEIDIEINETIVVEEYEN